MSAELIFVAPDELIAGDRVLVGAFLRTVITTQPDLGRPGILLVNHDGGTMPVAFDTDVQIAPNPQLGECDDQPVDAAGSWDGEEENSGPISHSRST